MDKELIRGLTEREVEIEHLKTTVIALNQKVEVSDTKIPIKIFKNLFELSEFNFVMIDHKRHGTRCQ